MPRLSRATPLACALTLALAASASAQQAATLPPPQAVQAPAPQPVIAPRPEATPAAGPQASAPRLPMAPVPATPGRAWILMDHATGQVLAGHEIDTPLDPASITKVMTSYVVAAEVAAGRVSMDDEVLISERAWREGGAGTDGSYSALAVNSRVRLGDVLAGLVIQSGNDAAIALAEHVAGTHEAFADLMNRYAAELGMANSHFVNAHGLTAEGHHMSARDIAILSRAMIRDFPEHYALYSTKEYTYNGIRQYNRNGLLWKDPSVDGIKTGHTAAAGYCLVASASREGQRLISVVMGIEGSRSEGFRQREDGNLALLNWGFRSFETHGVFNAGQEVASERVWRGELEQVSLGLAQPLAVTVPRGRYADLRPLMDVPTTLSAPIAAGQAVGTLRIMLDDEVVAERELVALAEVPEAGFFGRLWDDIVLWWESE